MAKAPLSLAQQLSLHKSANQHLNAIPHAAGNKTVPSLVFDPSEAAEYDERTILEVGRSGILELIERDPLLFDPWLDRFFSSETLDGDRALLSKEANAKLDAEIRAFLLTCSPHFADAESNAVGRVLEWMIRKYRVHALNVDALMDCAWPWHDTPAFIRLLQIVQLDGPSASSWAFLFERQREAMLLQPLSPGRQFFALRCTKDACFVDRIVENVCEQAVLLQSAKRPPSTLYSAAALCLADYWRFGKNLVRIQTVIDDFLRCPVADVRKIALFLAVEVIRECPQAKDAFVSRFKTHSASEFLPHLLKSTR